MTVTTDDEALLLSQDALDAESPGYVTDAFRLFNELIEQALGDEGDLAQIETYLNLLATHDPAFKYRRVQDENGNMTGYVWQTGVMRRDFELYAIFVGKNEVDELATYLGNPLSFVVEKPENDTKENIRLWMGNGKCNEVPSKAQHLVLLKCFFVGLENQQRDNIQVEVAVLQEGGIEMQGYETTYFPVSQGQDWMRQHCVRHQRTKHVLSALRKIENKWRKSECVLTPNETNIDVVPYSQYLSALTCKVSESLLEYRFLIIVAV